MSCWQVSCTYSTSASVMNNRGHMTVTVHADSESAARLAAIDEVYDTARRNGAYSAHQLAQISHVRPGRVERID